MDIFIVRHGIAEEGGAGISDHKRALTPEGRKKMKEIAKTFSQLEPEISHILASPLLRAWQTAEILAEALKMNVEEMQELSPEYSPADVVRHLQQMQRVSGVMLVGHQPNCSQLASHLLCNHGVIDVEFKKGAICRIYCDTLGAGEGMLISHFPPSALRSIGKVKGEK